MKKREKKLADSAESMESALDSVESRADSVAESRADSAESMADSVESMVDSRADSVDLALESSADSTNKGNSIAESRNTKKGTRGLRRIYNALFYSLSGLKSAWAEEEAFRQILIVSAILIPLGAYLGDSFAEKILLILPCVLAILAELANSAIENATDFAGLEMHPFAKNAKDMGSAMQLIACAFMGGVWIFYLIQRCLA